MFNARMEQSNFIFCLHEHMKNQSLNWRQVYQFDHVPYALNCYYDAKLTDSNIRGEFVESLS